MKLEAFNVGQWVTQYQYKSFSPVTVNREWSREDPQINTLLERASRALAELDAFTLIVPDVDLFIQMHTHWVKFFLSAVIETAGKGKQTFEGILALRQEMDQLTFGYGKRAKNVQAILCHLYRRPSITASQTSELLEVSHQTASSLLNKMAKDGMLDEITGYQRNRVFIFARYLTLFND